MGRDIHEICEYEIKEARTREHVMWCGVPAALYSLNLKREKQGPLFHRSIHLNTKTCEPHVLLLLCLWNLEIVASGIGGREGRDDVLAHSRRVIKA